MTEKNERQGKPRVSSKAQVVERCWQNPAAGATLDELHQAFRKQKAIIYLLQAASYSSNGFSTELLLDEDDVGDSALSWVGQVLEEYADTMRKCGDHLARQKTSTPVRPKRIAFHRALDAARRMVRREEASDE